MGRKLKTKPGDFERSDLFTGRIVSAEMEEGQYGEQVIIEYEPTSYEARDGGTSKLFMKYSESDKSNWFKFCRQLDKLGINFNELEDLVGLHLKFQRFEKDFELEDTDDFGEKYTKKVTSRYALPTAKISEKEAENIAKNLQEKNEDSEKEESPEQTKIDDKPKVATDGKPDPTDFILTALEKGTVEVKDIYNELAGKGVPKAKVLKAVKSLEADGLCTFEDGKVIPS